MSHDSEVERLLRNVTRMIQILAGLEDTSWVTQGRLALSQLAIQLDLSASDPQAVAAEALDRQFYLIVESHPRLRQAVQVVFQADLVDVCEEGLKYYARIRETRGLTQEEAECLLRVEENHRTSLQDYKRQQQEFLEAVLG
jgi:hypothetical protein